MLPSRSPVRMPTHSWCPTPPLERRFLWTLSALGAEGAIDCSNLDSNVYSMGTNNGVFSATYGLGTMLTDQLAQSRRRLDFIPLHSLVSRHLSVFNATNFSGVLENPLVCLKLQDSLLFDISNANYPEYAKDSLLNTNDNFDYSSSALWFGMLRAL
jgi:hypothetical protein